jgi:tRNA (Thr-GGU) A37 N-methylase
VSFLAFYHRAGRLEQLDHLQVSSHFHDQVGRLEQLDHLRVSSHFHHRAGRLEQLDHVQVSSHFIIGVITWKIGPMLKLLS